MLLLFIFIYFLISNRDLINRSTRVLQPIYTIPYIKEMRFPDNMFKYRHILHIYLLILTSLKTTRCQYINQISYQKNVLFIVLTLKTGGLYFISYLENLILHWI